MEKNQAKKENNISWTELSEEEILKVTDVVVCMYNGQDKDEWA